MKKKQKAVYSAFSRVSRIVVTVAIVIVVYCVALTAYDFGYRIFAEKPVSEAPGTEMTVVIDEGMSISAVAEMLENQGIIRDALIFKIQTRLSHYKTGFMAGAYTVSTSMSNEEIMAVLSGEVSQE